MAASSQTTTPNPKFSGLRSTEEYYERYRNANLFISNNANPFLISPYAPNQLSRTTANAILSANTIKPLTPGATIQIQGNVNVVSPYKLFFDNVPLLTDRIYAGPAVGTPAQVICSTTPDVTVELAGTANVVFQPDVATFENPTAPGTYSLFVSGTLSTAAIAVTTAATTPFAAGALAGTIPINVGGTLYKLALYNL